MILHWADILLPASIVVDRAIRDAFLAGANWPDTPLVFCCTGNGIVGGAISKLRTQGEHAARLALRILAGEKPETGPAGNASWASAMVPFFTNPISKTTLAVLLVLLVGCTTSRYESVSERNRALGIPAEEGEDNISYWDGDGMNGQPHIIVDLENQCAYFYKGHHLAGVSVVSTGREDYDTRPGKFHIMEKDIDHASSIYGDYVDRSGEVVVENVENGKDPRPRGTFFRGAPMPYFLRIHDGIGMHAGYLPGYPASHGCIRLPERLAEKFFENAPVGTPVEIR
jgi:L,D-transpeptidase catalytic domain